MLGISSFDKASDQSATICKHFVLTVSVGVGSGVGSGSGSGCGVGIGSGIGSSSQAVGKRSVAPINNV